MMLAKFSIAALGCLIAQTVRASQKPGAGVADTSRTSDPFGMAVAEVPRTLHEEIDIVSRLLDVEALQSLNREAKPVLAEETSQRETVEKMLTNFAKLKTIIDREKRIFRGSLDSSLPDYQGVNRYIFFKGLLKSMVLKLETLYGFLSTANEVSGDDLVRKMIELNLAKENEMIEGLTLRDVTVFFKALYDKDSPIFVLLTLFDEFESNLPHGDLLAAESHPFSTLYKDTGEPSDALSTLDESNSRMEIRAPEIVKLPSSEGEESTSDVREGADGDSVQVREDRTQAEMTSGGDARGANPTPGATSSSSTTTTTSESTSLRSGAAEASPKKASSAFEPFVMLLIVMSAAFAF